MRQKVLVILPNNLGDVVMAAPVLEGLKRGNPEMHTTFFVENGYEGGLVNNPFCNAIFLFKRGAFRDLSRTADWPQASQALSDIIATLKNERFDRVINLSQHSYIPFIVALLSCPNTVGREYLRGGNHAVRDLWSQYLYAIPFARRSNNLHATDIYKRIAGIKERIPAAAMPVTEEERTAARKKIAAHGWDPDGKPVIVLQPGAAFDAKRWPLEHFVALGKRLVGDGYTILVTGAPQEREIALFLATALGTAGFTTAGLLSFRETIALLPSVTACVTGDTAIMHASAALKRKVFALFGPTNPIETGPYSEDNVVICGRCAKRPCFCFDCKSKLCMKSIMPDDVYSCIKCGKVGNVGCDIYTTSFKADGTYALNRIVEKGPPLFNGYEADLARKFSEPEYSPATSVAGPDREPAQRETDCFLEIVAAMATSLGSFMETRDKNDVRNFEDHRAKLAALSGIGAFWTAILNLRLNSVPMIDPVAAVKECQTICLEIKKEVRNAASVIK